MSEEIEVTVDETKEVISALVQNFIAEEKGNKVTNNNMTGLLLHLMGAVEGKLRVKQEGESNGTTENN